MKLQQIKRNNILVVGDVILDTYFLGEIKRISPEAPVPVFRKKSERCVLGGAANVAANLLAAGQNVFVMSMVGNDENGNKIRNLLEEQGADTSLIISMDRKTTEKTRLITSSNHQVLRLDVEDTFPMESKTCAEILNILDEQIDKFDLILLSDYMKGFLTYELTQGVIQRANERNIPVIIDVKDPKTEKYKGAFLIKPNLEELRNLTGMSVESDEEIIAASQKLRKVCCAKYVLTTCGARGMVLVGEKEPYSVATAGKEVFDVTGAGDTVIAYLAACMTSGFAMKDAVTIANYAAGIQVSKAGTSSVYWDEIRKYLTNEEMSKGKILTETAVDSFRKDHYQKKIVFTNGCFDILHVGHLRYMQEAAKLGDILVVGLNSDDSVKRLKGKDRPINNQKDRAEMLAALEFVDYVAIFDEDTPYELIKRIQPDILVKGGDYQLDDVVGRDLVENRGGEVKLLKFVEGKSTTNIVNKIKG